MDLFEAISRRQSYRGRFSEADVPREDLVRIVDSGLKAPSGTNAETTSFIIVDDPQILQQIRALHPKNKAMQEAAAYIACITDVKPQAVYEGYEFQAEDCAVAVQNMLLAITALGYASVWVDGWLRLENRARLIGSLLGVPDDKIIRVILPIGIPTESYPRPKKKRFEERAWFNRFGAA